MKDLLADLEQLKQEAGGSLAAAASRERLQAWHGDFLGRRGRLAHLMRQLGEAPAGAAFRLRLPSSQVLAPA